MPIGPKKKKLKRPNQPQTITYPELEFMFDEMRRIKNEGMRFLELERAVLNFMESHGLLAYVRANGKTATPVYGTTEQVDWNGIRKAIGPKHWEAILGEPQPVKAKLLSLIELGMVTAEQISPFVQEKPSKPYINSY